MATTLAVDLIDTSSCIGREWIDPELVKKYIEQMRSGDTFPPIEVFHDGSTYWLADGHHRLCAMTYFDVNGEDIGIGLREVACTVHQGTEDDAAWYSAGANREHGTPSSVSDKRSCVIELLRRTSIAKAKSNGVIAKQVGCDESWVRKVRPEPVQVRTDSEPEQRSGLDGKAYPATNTQAQRQLQTVAEAVLASPTATVRQVAATTGASVGTVAKIKKEATANPDMPASELAKRKGSAPKAEDKAPFSSPVLQQAQETEDEEEVQEEEEDTEFSTPEEELAGVLEHKNPSVLATHSTSTASAQKFPLAWNMLLSMSPSEFEEFVADFVHIELSPYRLQSLQRRIASRKAA